jgi:hypothetical protein
VSTLSRSAQATRSPLVWAMCVVLVIASCAAPNQTPAPSGGASATVGTPAPGTSVPSAPVAVAVPSMMDKIEAAERNGTLDHDTALVYELYAALDVGSLPSEYLSDSNEAPEGTGPLAELVGRLDQLTPELRGRVEPILKRPTEVDSFWALRDQRSSQGVVSPLALSAPITLAQADDLDLEYGFVDANISTPIRVWYALARGDSERQLAQKLATEAETTDMWAKEKKAMVGRQPCSDLEQEDPRNGGNENLDVYLIRPLTSLSWNGRTATVAVPEARSIFGITVPVEAGAGCAWITYIALNGALGWDDLRVTLAHELFHSFQLSFRNTGFHDRHWWLEASATWAEDLVYPLRDTERIYLPSHWSDVQGPAGPIDSTEGTAEYAAYLWPFFARQRAGGDETEIGQVFEQQEGAKSPLQVIHDTAGWAESFRKFALWNWNSTAVTDYVDAGRPIPEAELHQQTTCLKNDCIIPIGKQDLYLTLRRTSTEYFEGTPAKDVKQLRFDLSDLKGKAGAGVQAIVSIGQPGPGSEVRVEDWTGLDKRIFCIAREDVRKIVLVLSNSEIVPADEIRPTADIPPKMETIPSGPTILGKIAIEALAEGCGLGGLVTYNRTIVKSVATDLVPCGSHTIDETTTVTISVAFDGNNKGTATVSDQGNSVEVSTAIDCNTGKTYTTTATRSYHVVGTKDIFLFWWINAGVLDFNAVWEHVTGGTQVNELRCTPVSCDKTSVEEVMSSYISVAFKADVDEKAAVISGSKVEDASSEGESDITTYTWTIER